MRKLLWSVAVLTTIGAILVTWYRAEAAPPEFPGDLRAFMQLKLKSSQQVLEGIVMEDFDRVVKHGQQLSLLSQDTTWQVLQTPEYLQHSIEFRRAADALTEAARKKNVDGAALAYMDVTLKCVNCHKYVRSTRMAAKEETKGR